MQIYNFIPVTLSPRENEKFFMVQRVKKWRYVLFLFRVWNRELEGYFKKE